MKTSSIFSLIAAVALSVVVNAASADRVDNRQVKTRSRIHNGVKTGELTRGEAAGLRQDERHIRRMERRGADPAKIEKAQDRLSHKIYAQKHDAQKRPKNNGTEGPIANPPEAPNAPVDTNPPPADTNQPEGN